MKEISYKKSYSKLDCEYRVGSRIQDDSEPESGEIILDEYQRDSRHKRDDDDSDGGSLPPHFKLQGKSSKHFKAVQPKASDIIDLVDEPATNSESRPASAWGRRAVADDVYKRNDDDKDRAVKHSRQDKGAAGDRLGRSTDETRRRNGHAASPASPDMTRRQSRRESNNASSNHNTTKDNHMKELPKAAQQSVHSIGSEDHPEILGSEEQEGRRHTSRQGDEDDSSKSAGRMIQKGPAKHSRDSESGEQAGGLEVDREVTPNGKLCAADRPHDPNQGGDGKSSGRKLGKEEKSERKGGLDDQRVRGGGSAMQEVEMRDVEEKEHCRARDTKGRALGSEADELDAEACRGRMKEKAREKEKRREKQDKEVLEQEKKGQKVRGRDDKDRFKVRDDKEKHRSREDKGRDKEKDREKGREKAKAPEKEKVKENQKERERDKDIGRESDRDKERDKDKKRHREDQGYLHGMRGEKRSRDDHQDSGDLADRLASDVRAHTLDNIQRMHHSARPASRTDGASWNARSSMGYDRSTGFADRERFRVRERERDRERDRDREERKKEDDRRLKHRDSGKDRVTDAKKSKKRKKESKHRDREIPVEEQEKMIKTIEAAFDDKEDDADDDEEKQIQERRKRLQNSMLQLQEEKTHTASIVAPTATEVQHQQQQQQQQQQQKHDTEQQQGRKPSLEADKTPESKKYGSSVKDDARKPNQSLPKQRDHRSPVTTQTAGSPSVSTLNGMSDRMFEVEKRGPGDQREDGTANKGQDGEVQGDMFAKGADADDIFATTPTNKLDKALNNAVKNAAHNQGVDDAYDDDEGYYNFRSGEIVDQRYEIYSYKGKGVFSTVVWAKDRVRKDTKGNHPVVAIKMIRANETMHKAAQLEKKILQQLYKTDPDGKKHCVRLLRSFEYRNHMCLVFEALDMNLRELIKKYGRGIGISIEAVQHYATQLFVSLRHLKTNSIIHADIKPDNILVSEDRKKVKLCDFGSAMENENNDPTPYLVSRFYRPPEVILGMKYEFSVDMWSMGCVLYEMFTGHILFAGSTNNLMLHQMMDLKGAFPKKMLKKGMSMFVDKHFDSSKQFILEEIDPVHKAKVSRLVPNPTVKRSLQNRLLDREAETSKNRPKESDQKTKKRLQEFCDLLDQMLTLDPEKRITPDDALRHPFLRRSQEANIKYDGKSSAQPRKQQK